MVQRLKLERALGLASPLELYTRATATIMDPMRRTSQSFMQLGFKEQLSMARFSGPLALSQSVLVVVPYIITLVAITVLCFAISYSVFMRQEIRSI